MKWAHFVEELHIECLSKYEGMDMWKEAELGTTLKQKYINFVEKAKPSGYIKKVNGYDNDSVYTWEECGESEAGYKIKLTFSGKSEFPTLSVIVYDKYCYLTKYILTQLDLKLNFCIK